MERKPLFVSEMLHYKEKFEELLKKKEKFEEAFVDDSKRCYASRDGEMCLNPTR